MMSPVGKWIVPLACVLASTQTLAVNLNPRGTGQVLLYPYYTVNAGNQTLLSVGNSTAHGKALRVRFLEGRNGRSTLSFNLYLSPYDVWTAAIFSQTANGPAALVTDDNSCTYPAIKTSTSLPSLSDGRTYVDFRNYAYTGSFDDAGPDGLARTREGSVEIIEMGTVIDASPTYNAMVHHAVGSASIPVNCSYLVNGWGSGGFWTSHPTTDLHNPTGGLFGSIGIVNTAAGTMLSYGANALEEFRQDPADSPRGSISSVVLHTIATDPRPNLADALTDPTQNLASASVFVDGRLVRADYPADTRGIDAVTAALMSDILSNDYIVDPAAGAQSEWVLSFPTRHFYTDQAIVGSTAIAPFTRVYTNGDSESGECMGAGYRILNREEASTTEGCDIDFLLPPGWCPVQVNLCYDVQTVPMNQRHGQTLDGTGFLGSSVAVRLNEGGPVDVGFLHGWLRLNLIQAGNESYPGDGLHRMRPAQDGTVFEGLPALGFLATNFVNNNVQPGILANYSGTFPHRSTAKCTRTGATCP